MHQILKDLKLFTLNGFSRNNDSLPLPNFMTSAISNFLYSLIIFSIIKKKLINFYCGYFIVLNVPIY